MSLLFTQKSMSLPDNFKPPSPTFLDDEMEEMEEEQDGVNERQLWRVEMVWIFIWRYFKVIYTYLILGSF